MEARDIKRNKDLDNREINKIENRHEANAEENTG